MEPSVQTVIQQDERATIIVLEELGQSIRASYDAMTEEPLSHEMALLLLRLALAQSLATFAKREAPEFVGAWSLSNGF